VVPDVNAIRQTSSAAVSAAANSGLASATSCSSETGFTAAPIDDPLQARRDAFGFFHFVGKPAVAQRQSDFRLLDRIGQLFGAQQRHGSDHGRHRLQDREVRRNHHRTIGRFATARGRGHKAELADQHIGDAIHQLLHLTVGIAGIGVQNAGLVAAALFDPSIEKMRHAIQPVRILAVRAA